MRNCSQGCVAGNGPCDDVENGINFGWDGRGSGESMSAPLIQDHRISNPDIPMHAPLHAQMSFSPPPRRVVLSSTSSTLPNYFHNCAGGSTGRSLSAWFAATPLDDPQTPTLSAPSPGQIGASPPTSSQHARFLAVVSMGEASSSNISDGGGLSLRSSHTSVSHTMPARGSLGEGHHLSISSSSDFLGALQSSIKEELGL